MAQNSILEVIRLLRLTRAKIISKYKTRLSTCYLIESESKKVIIDKYSRHAISYETLLLSNNLKHAVSKIGLTSDVLMFDSVDIYEDSNFYYCACVLIEGTSLDSDNNFLKEKYFLLGKVADKIYKCSPQFFNAQSTSRLVQEIEVKFDLSASQNMAIEYVKKLDNKKEYIIHGDLNVTNIIINKINPFIKDFQDCIIAYPEMELAISISYIHDQQLFVQCLTELLNGFKSEINLSLLSKLVILAPLYLCMSQIRYINQRDSDLEIIKYIALLQSERQHQFLKSTELAEYID